MSDFRIVDGVLISYKGNDELVVVPEGVVWIGYKAFSNHDHIKSVFLPDSVAFIKDGAFEDCSQLARIRVSAGLKEIGCSAFSKCTNLKSIELPYGLVSIREFAFYSCGLTTLTIPESVTLISHHAFACCKELEVVTIPKSVNVHWKSYDWFINCLKLHTIHTGRILHERTFGRIKPSPLRVNDLSLFPQSFVVNALLTLARESDSSYEYWDNHIEYLKDRIIPLANMLIDNMEILKFALKQKLLSCISVEHYLDVAHKRNAIEAIMALTEYQINMTMNGEIDEFSEFFAMLGDGE